MTDLELFTEDGDPIVPTDGLEAVTEEYRGWRARWRTGRTGAIYAQLGPSLVELPQQDGFFVAPPLRQGKKKRAEDEGRLRKGYAGRVAFYADKDFTQPLRPWLRLEPSNMSEQQFKVILADLKNLIFSISIYLRPTEARVAAVPARIQAASELQVLASAARELLALVDLLQEQLPLIERNPSRYLDRSMSSLSVERALRRGHAREVAQSPEGKPRIRIAILEESVDTPERRFVEAVMVELRRDAGLLSATIGAQLQLKRAGTREAEIGRAIGIPPPLDPRRTISDSIETLPQLLDDAAQQLTASHTRVPESGANPDDLRTRTNRMILSQEYGPITAGWDQYRRRVPISTAVDSAIDQLDERSIANSPKLYEQWVTVKLYASLVRRGFRPPAGERSLLDDLRVGDRDGLLRSAQRPLILTRQASGRLVELRLQHEPRMVYDESGNYVTPDLVVRASAGEMQETWVLDAKYKDYTKPPHTSKEQERAKRLGSHFLSDLVGVAEEHYRARFGYDLGAIIHPDFRPECTSWDDDARSPAHRAHTRSPDPHMLIACPLLPGADGEENIVKLLRLLLGYRLGLSSTCWRCGQEGTRDYEAPTHGDAFRCGGCHAFWVVAWCTKCHHSPLLKFPGASFHRVEDPADALNVSCPCCGARRRDTHGPRTTNSPIGTTPFIRRPLVRNWDEEPF